MASKNEIKPRTVGEAPPKQRVDNTVLAANGVKKAASKFTEGKKKTPIKKKPDEKETPNKKKPDEKEYDKRLENLKQKSSQGSENKRNLLTVACMYEEDELAEYLLKPNSAHLYDFDPKFLPPGPLQFSIIHNKVTFAEIIIKGIKNLDDLHGDKVVKDEEADDTIAEIAENGNDGVRATNSTDSQVTEDLTEDDSRQYPNIHLACMFGRSEIANLIFGKERDLTPELGKNKSVLVNTLDFEKKTPLYCAIENNHPDVAELCILNGAKVKNYTSKVDQRKTSLLHITAAGGDQKAFDILRKQGVQINIENTEEETPLYTAAAHNNIEVCEALLAIKGVGIEKKNNKGFTPLLIAAKNGQTKAVKALLHYKEGANIWAKTQQGKTAFHLAAMCDHKEILKVMLEHIKKEKAQAMFDLLDEKGNTPLHTAAEYGKLKALKCLCDNKLDKFAQNFDGRTPLHLASMSGMESAVKELLAKQQGQENQQNQQVSLKDKDGNTALHLAAKAGKNNVISVLLGVGKAKIDARNNSKAHPLHIAARENFTSTCELLIENNADFDAADEDQDTPLHVACAAGSALVVSLLIEKGANVTKENKDKNTCLDEAIEKNEKESASAVIASEKWKEALKTYTVVDGLFDTPMRKLIRDMPDVAREVLKKCSVRTPKRKKSREKKGYGKVGGGQTGEEANQLNKKTEDKNGSHSGGDGNSDSEKKEKNKQKSGKKEDVQKHIDLKENREEFTFIYTFIDDYHWLIVEEIKRFKKESKRFKEKESTPMEKESQRLKEESEQLKKKSKQLKEESKQLKEEESKQWKKESKWWKKESQRFEKESQRLKEESELLKKDSNELKEESKRLKEEESKRLEEQSKEMKEKSEQFEKKSKGLKEEESKQLKERESKQLKVESKQLKGHESKELTEESKWSQNESKRLKEESKRLVEESQRLEKESKRLKDESKQLEESKQLKEESKQLKKEDRKQLTEESQRLEKIKRLEKESKLLKEESKRLIEEESQKLTKERQRLEKECKRLKEESKQLTEESQRLEKESKQLKEESKRLKEEDSKGLKEESKQLKEESKRLKEEDSKRLKEESKRLEKERKRLKEKSKELEKESKQLKEESKWLKEEESQRLMDESKRLEKESKRLKEESKQLEKDSKQLKEEDSKRLKEESKWLQKESERFEKESERLEKESKRLNEESKRLREGESRSLKKEESNRLESESERLKEKSEQFEKESKRLEEESNQKGGKESKNLRDIKKQRWTDNKNHCLKVMINYKREDLMSLPVVRSLLRKKWQHYGAAFFCVNLFFYALFLVFLNSYMLSVAFMAPHLYRNGSDVSFTGTECERIKRYTIGLGFPVGLSKYGWVSRISMCVIAAMQLLVELFQLFFSRRSYFTHFENMFSWFIYMSAAIFAMDFNDCQRETGVRLAWQWQLGAMCVFWSWIHLLLFIRKMPLFGLYVVMFTTILQSFLLFLPILLLFLIAFAMSFHFLLANQVSFRYVMISFFKVTVMMIGELDYGNSFDDRINSTDPEVLIWYDVVTYIQFALFLIIMSILIMNLMIGLAVDDIQGVLSDSTLQTLAMQAEFLIESESIALLFKREAIAAYKVVKQALPGQGEKDDKKGDKKSDQEVDKRGEPDPIIYKRHKGKTGQVAKLWVLSGTSIIEESYKAEGNELETVTEEVKKLKQLAVENKGYVQQLAVENKEMMADILKKLDSLKPVQQSIEKK